MCCGEQQRREGFRLVIDVTNREEHFFTQRSLRGHPRQVRGCQCAYRVSTVTQESETQILLSCGRSQRETFSHARNPSMIIFKACMKEASSISEPPIEM